LIVRCQELLGSLMKNQGRCCPNLGLTNQACFSYTKTGFIIHIIDTK